MKYIRKNDTKITYDTNQSIVGIGVNPYYRLGPEKWFDDYAVISYLPWQVADDNAMRSYSLRDLTPSLEIYPESTAAILASKEYKDIVADYDLKDHYTVTYKPISSRGGYDFTRTFENKAWIRSELGASLPFPASSTVKLSDLLADPPALYVRLQESCETQQLVIQHEQLSGGRGTFFAKNSDEFSEAVSALGQYPGVGADDDVVVSAMIDGEELSVQACITKSGTLVGPMQRQIVRHSLLVNTTSQTANQFCGGMVSDEKLFGADIRSKVIEVVGTISDGLAAEGFKGIFGVDFLVSGNERDQLSLIEVNARMTGMLPLLTQVQKDYPFLLLHILEHAGIEYSLSDDIDLSHPESLPDAVYVVVNDTLGYDLRVGSGMVSGRYAKDAGKLSNSLYLGEEAFLLHNYTTQHQLVKGDGRLGAVFSVAEVDFDHELGGIDEGFIKQFVQSLHS